MAKGKWVTLKKYYNDIGQSLYPDEWGDDFIKLLVRHKKKKIDKSCPRYKKAVSVRRALRKRIRNEMQGVKVVYGDGQGYVSATFEVKDWYIPRSECMDTKGVFRKCKILLPSTEKRGSKPKHDKDYLLSIFKDVLKYVRGKISYRSVSDAYCEYFKVNKIDKGSPSKSWIETNIYEEVKKAKETRGF